MRPDGAVPATPPSRRPDSALARRLRRSRSVRRFANDGSWASKHIFGLSIGVGLVLSLLVPPDIPGPVGRVSAALGWASTGCWFLGWYPQIVSNWHRSSAAGVSLTYLSWNCLGFLCYSIFTCTLFWSEPVRAEYRAAHGGHDSDVRSNDVFFALHALAMCVVNGVQAALYGAGGQSLSVAAAMGVGGAAVYVFTYFRLWAAGHCGCVSAMQVLNALAAVKVCTTAVKYLPQIAMHARTKSTAGFSSANALTDAAGGALSLSQLLLDASPLVAGDAGLITGDLPKLGLALLSMLYSGILIGQHLVYGGGDSGGGGPAGDGSGDGAWAADDDGSGAPLLG